MAGNVVLGGIKVAQGNAGHSDVDPLCRPHQFLKIDLHKSPCAILKFSGHVQSSLSAKVRRLMGWRWVMKSCNSF